MSNENFGENVKKEIKVTGIIKNEETGDYSQVDTPEYKNKEGRLIKEKETEVQMNIGKINEAISSFEEIRKKYSHENFLSTTKEDKEKLTLSRDHDNSEVRLAMELLQGKESESNIADHEKQQIGYYLQEMNNFLNNNKHDIKYLLNKYSGDLIDKISQRLKSEGINNVDSLIGIRDFIDNQDFKKFPESVKSEDIENLIASYEQDKEEFLAKYNTYKDKVDNSGFVAELGESISKDTSFFDRKIAEVRILLSESKKLLVN